MVIAKTVESVTVAARDLDHLLGVHHLAQQKNDHTTASAGCATCAIPIVPI